MSSILKSVRVKAPIRTTKWKCLLYSWIEISGGKMSKFCSFPLFLINVHVIVEAISKEIFQRVFIVA